MIVNLRDFCLLNLWIILSGGLGRSSRIVILIFTFCQRGLTNEVSASREEDLENSCKSPGHCSVEDEGPCKDDGEQKLYRWDPVKVCHFLTIISSKVIQCVDVISPFFPRRLIQCLAAFVRFLSDVCLNEIR